MLSAAIVSRLMPEIERFYLIYAWMKDSEFTRTMITKDEMKAVWLEYMPRAAQIDAAKRTTSFEANPTPLCAYCPVSDCPHIIERD